MKTRDSYKCVQYEYIVNSNIQLFFVLRDISFLVFTCLEKKNKYKMFVFIINNNMRVARQTCQTAAGGGVKRQHD